MTTKTIGTSDILSLDNTRANIGDLANLMHSIKESGLIQPIVVAKNFTESKHPYVLVAGNRRFNAVKKLGMDNITATVTSKVKDEKDLIIVNITENIQRENVSVSEQGRFIHKLINEHDMSVNECAVRIGINNKVIKQMLSVYEKTPKQFQSKITFKSNEKNKGKIALTTAATINTLRKSNLINSKQHKELLKKAQDNTYNSSRVRQISEALRKGYLFEEVIDGITKTISVQLRVPLLSSERDEVLDGGEQVQSYLLKVIYGEVADHFTRPKI